MSSFLTLAKPTILKFHRWLGVSLGFVLILQGLTGCIVAFRPELNRAIHRDALVIAPAPQPASLQTLADNARAVDSAAVLTRLDAPAFPDGAFFARLEHPKTGDVTLIALDPNTGSVLREGGFAAWPVELAFELHYELVSGDAGERTVGFFGLALFSMTVMGLLIWWPGWGHIRRSLAVKFSGRTIRVMRDLHRTAGALIAAVMLAGSLTGIGLAWKPWIRPVLASFTEMSDFPPEANPATCGNVRSVDDVVQAARDYEDGAHLRSVRFKGRQGALVTVHLFSKQLERPRAADRVLVDACTATVLAAKDADELSAGDLILDWLLPIHSGEWLGTPGRVLMMLMALSLVALGGTGYFIWSARGAAPKTPR